MSEAEGLKLGSAAVGGFDIGGEPGEGNAVGMHIVRYDESHLFPV